jgi:hypothetical protein
MGVVPCTMLQKCASPIIIIIIILFLFYFFKMVNVYRLSILIREKEEILCPSPLPPITTIIITATTLNLSKPSSYYNNNCNNKGAKTHMNIKFKTPKLKKKNGKAREKTIKKGKERARKQTFKEKKEKQVNKHTRK